MDAEGNSPQLVFTLLSRKKQQQIHVPVDTRIAEDMLARQKVVVVMMMMLSHLTSSCVQEEETERQLNKQRVIEFDQRNAEQEENDMLNRFVDPMLTEQPV